MPGQGKFPTGDIAWTMELQRYGPYIPPDSDKPVFGCLRGLLQARSTVDLSDDSVRADYGKSMRKKFEDALGW